MWDTPHLYGRYIGISIRSQMQYRASFVMQTIGHFLVTGIEFLAVWALFARFGQLKGWSLPEVALLYGMAQVSFAIADAVSRGYDLFGNLVKSGDFDRLLLRPRTTQFQVAAQEITLKRIGRLTQGLAALAWAAMALRLPATPERVALIGAAIVGGACLFHGLVILQATAAFWTVESLEIFNILTYGGATAAEYPLTIYHDWMRRLFTWIVPIACVNYLPAYAILGRPRPPEMPAALPWLSPLMGLAFLLAARQAWGFGVRHYRSTGS
ncbi:MAG TPA: ABC-2 family transporter protein [Armatimonadota bacterium]|jgi:ABC-2 type transport system permease protein